MRRADFTSDADYYRAHRQAFVLAQQLGVTPIEAEVELKKRQRQECAARLQAKIEAPLQPGMAALRGGHDPEEPREPWWNRD